MLAVKEQIRDLNQQHKELLESKSARDITQEFVIRSKQRDLSIACKVSVGSPFCYLFQSMSL